MNRPEPMRASELVALLQAEIAEHGDGYAQVEVGANWHPVRRVISWKGRTLLSANMP